eukprot:g3230.t1
MAEVAAVVIAARNADDEEEEQKAEQKAMAGQHAEQSSVGRRPDVRVGAMHSSAEIEKLLPVSMTDATQQQVAIAEQIIHKHRLGDDRQLTMAQKERLLEELATAACDDDAMLDARSKLVRPSAVMRDLAARTERAVDRNRNYCMLFKFLFHFVLYLVILLLQRRPDAAYAVESAISGALFNIHTLTVEPHDGRVEISVPDTATVYNWLDKNLLQAVYTDPVCGNGVCDAPLEFPGGFPQPRGNYGCDADCGAAPVGDMTTLQVVFDFAGLDAAAREAGKRGWFCFDAPAHDMSRPGQCRCVITNRVQLYWNLCLHRSQSAAHSSDICAFPRQQVSTSPVRFVNGKSLPIPAAGGHVEELRVFEGDWQVHVWAATQKVDVTTGATVVEHFPYYRPEVRILTNATVLGAAQNGASQALATQGTGVVGGTTLFRNSGRALKSAVKRVQRVHRVRMATHLTGDCSDAASNLDFLVGQCTVAQANTWKFSVNGNTCNDASLVGEIWLGSQTCTGPPTAHINFGFMSANEKGEMTLLDVCEKGSSGYATRWTCVQVDPKSNTSGSLAGGVLWAGRRLEHDVLADAMRRAAGGAGANMGAAGPMATSSIVNASHASEQGHARWLLGEMKPPGDDKKPPGDDKNPPGDNKTPHTNDTKPDYGPRPPPPPPPPPTPKPTPSLPVLDPCATFAAFIYRECVGDKGSSQSRDVCVKDGMESWGKSLPNDAPSSLRNAFRVAARRGGTEMPDLGPATQTRKIFPQNLNPRRRMFAAQNRVLGGVLLGQKRDSVYECATVVRSTDGREHTLGACSGDAPNGTTAKLWSEPYGSDPCYLQTSALYNSDLNRTGLARMPFGFSPDMFSGRASVTSFPVYFDTDLGAERTQLLLRYLKDGFYIDAQTRELDVKMILYNAFHRFFCVAEVTFVFEKGGVIRLVHSVRALRTELYATSADNFRLALEGLWALLVLWNIGMELGELYHSVRAGVKHEHKRCGDSRNWAKGAWGGFLAYSFDLWNAVDWANIVVQVQIAVAWGEFYLRFARDFAPRDRYDGALADLHAKSNFLKVGAGFAAVQDVFQQASSMNALMARYTALNVVSVILMTLRVIKLLDFQARLGLVTRTLAKAAMDLCHFFSVFVLVLCTYAFVGHISFGSTLRSFSTFGRAVATLSEILLGEVEDVRTDLIRLPMSAPAMFYFWSYILLAFFLLTNMMLAILVDAYVAVKKDASSTSTVIEDLQSMARAVCGKNMRHRSLARMLRKMDPLREAADSEHKQARNDLQFMSARQKPADFLALDTATRRGAPGLTLGDGQADAEVVAATLLRYGYGRKKGTRSEAVAANKLESEMEAIEDGGRATNRAASRTRDNKAHAMAHSLIKLLADKEEDDFGNDASGDEQGPAARMQFEDYVVDQLQKIHVAFRDRKVFEARVMSKLGITREDLVEGDPAD